MRIAALANDVQNCRLIGGFFNAKRTIAQIVGLHAIKQHLELGRSARKINRRHNNQLICGIKLRVQFFHVIGTLKKIRILVKLLSSARIGNARRLMCGTGLHRLRCTGLRACILYLGWWHTCLRGRITSKRQRRSCVWKLLVQEIKRQFRDRSQENGVMRILFDVGIKQHFCQGSAASMRARRSHNNQTVQEGLLRKIRCALSHNA